MCNCIKVKYLECICKYGNYYIVGLLVLEHLHNCENKFRFSVNKSGFYNFKLTATKSGQVVYPYGTITILQGSEVVKKFENLDAISEVHANNLVFYANQWITYYVVIEFTDVSVETLELTVEKLSNIELNAADSYNSTTSVESGDKLNLLTVPRSGRYEINITCSGVISKGIPFYILKANENGTYTIIGKTILSTNNNNHYVNVDIKAGDEFYIGYFNGGGLGTITINIERIVLKTFNLYTDPKGGVVGTEVSINGGDYRGLRIMQGYTRICYLENNAPNLESRLNYEWFSTNPAIATVSDYGTITAISPGNVRIIVVYKGLNTIVGYIDIQVYEAPQTDIVYLQYGMDVRVGGTTSGTEVTSGLGDVIPVGVNPEVTIHRGYNRLICLGSDSPSASIQDFTWTSSNTNIATVSAYGTVGGVSSGTVVITGVYKYNQNYMVVIEITII